MSEACDKSIHQLYEYLDAELDEKTSAEIRSHLDECPPCWESFDFERRLKGVVHGHLSEDMPQGLLSKVQDLIRQEKSGGPA